MLQRSITGLIFLIIFIGSLLYNMYTMAIFFFVVATIATSELFRLIAKFDVAPQEMMGGVTEIASFEAITQLDRREFAVARRPMERKASR